MLSLLASHRRSLVLAALALASVGAALAACSSGDGCGNNLPPQEYCFDWPLPADGGTVDSGATGDPGPCPEATSDEARLDVDTFGTPTSGSLSGEGAFILDGGAVKPGKCCYQAQPQLFCE